VSEDSTLNSQIGDALAQIDASIAGAGSAFVAAAAYQSVSHTIALALQNSVAQQQQAYMLRNALTAAAANAILDGKREEADAILAMADSKAISHNVAAEIEHLLSALRAVDDDLRKWRDAPDTPEPLRAREAAASGN
jgi:hypothetical protein